MLTTKSSPLGRRNRRLARQKWGLERNHPLLATLKSLTEDLALFVSAGDVILPQGNWYVTHAGLLRIAKRNQFQNALRVARFICHGELSCEVPLPRGEKVNILEHFRKHRKSLVLLALHGSSAGCDQPRTVIPL